MIKRDPHGTFTSREVGFFHKKRVYCFYAGKIHLLKELEENEYHSLLEAQKFQPIAVMHDTRSTKRWWMYRSVFYVENEGRDPEETRILILDFVKRDEAKFKRAQTRLSQTSVEEVSFRKPIPDDVKILVWQRDRGRCVRCGSNQNLEYDHIIPLAKGGSNTARNLQLLCENCNREKGANLF